MNDTIRGGLAMTLVGLVVLVIGSATGAEIIGTFGVIGICIGLLTAAWGLVQGMTPKDDDAS